ncbi:MAG: ATP synthase F1 subunit delta [Acidobacteriota bacterium]
MAKVDDKQVALAGIYSRALLDLAHRQGKTTELLDELRQVAALSADNEAFAQLLSPLVESTQRRDSLERLFRGKLSDLTVDALQVINDKERLNLLPTIVEVLRREVLAASGRVDATVRTAVELSDALRADLERAVARYTGHEADLEIIVDPSLIGGFVLQIGDEKIDASVRRRINELRHTFAQRSARELHRLRRSGLESATGDEATGETP